MPKKSEYDLFLSYSSADRDAVLEIRSGLENLGVKTFVDRANLNPGQPWPKELEDALASCRGVAVFVGNRPELGTWQLRESWMALDRQAREQKDGRSFPVVPVLLPRADPSAGFLFLNTWVDLRSGISDAEGIGRLAQAVRAPADPALAPAPAYSDVCPYRGLEPFRRQDEPFFLGREALSEELLEKVLTHDLVAVLGPSGSGKSSVVQAGLLPALGRHSEGRAWEVATLRPGKRPFRALGRQLVALLEPALDAVDRLARGNELGDHFERGRVELHETVDELLTQSHGSTRLLLIVDQFEELFRETREEELRPFVEALIGARGHSLGIVATMRSDFYDHALRLGRIADDLLAAVVNVRPLEEDELSRLVREPARKVGLTFEPGLAEDILREIGAEVTRLPLLEFCLLELWRGREGRSLTHAAYEVIGRVEGALARRADRALSKLSTNLVPAAQSLFTDRLVRVAAEGEAGSDTKRPAPLAELSADEMEVVTAFSARDARLLVVDERSVEIVHEALIERWETLREWIEAGRTRLLSRRERRVFEQVDRLLKRVSGAEDFLEQPIEFLEAASRALFHLALDEAPYEALSEVLWRLDFLAKAATDEVRARSEEVGGELRTAFREALAGRLGIEPPAIADEEFVLVQPDLVSIADAADAPVEASFLMGSSREREQPAHPVILSPYRIGRHQVTNALYSTFDPDLPVPSQADSPRLPVVEVSWHEAYAFAAWLGGRLPTEAEWECACRAETTSKWSFGDEESEIENHGWVRSNSGDRAHPVGELTPNDWGLYDMHGNVWEWVADCYGPYLQELQVDPQGPATTSGRRVIRGGSFVDPADVARSAFRVRFEPGHRYDFLGFRVVLPAPCRDSRVDPGS